MIKMVIADDERLIRESLHKLMAWENIGAEVVGVAADGAAAMNLVRELSPQILLSDISMPEMDGIELITKIREEKLGCHVIFLSAHSNFSYAQNAVKYGAFDYILKPIDEDELMATVARCIEVIKQEEQAQLTKRGQSNDIMTISLESEECFSGSWLVAQAVEYIKENYATATLAEIANQLYISSTYLSRIFASEMNSSFSRYLRKYRIEVAKDLLLDPQYKIYNVATMVGYSDIAHFSKAFKQVEGVSPMKYKNISNLK